MRLYYCDHHEIPLPAGHKFPIRKYRLLREALTAAGGFDFQPAPLAPLDTIALVHDRAYVEAFLNGTLDPSVQRRIGFPWSEGLVSRTLASVGGTLSASLDALAVGCGGGLAGGTHHAFRSEGAGFCVFNDIAVAVVSLRSMDRIRRAAILDLDVHQGDGTATIFEGDPDVYTVSLHNRHNFPFRKQRSVVDVELEDGVTDDEYIEHLVAVLPDLLEFEPDIVFYQSGVDALASDKLGRLALTQDGLRARDEIVLNTCAAARIPVVITLGGGYSDPIERTVEAHSNTFLLAAEIFGSQTS